MKYIKKLYFFCLTGFLFSCVTYNKYPYLISDKLSKNDSISFNTNKTDYLLQVADVLDIQVSSNVESEIEIINKKFDNETSLNTSVYSSYFKGYIIDNNGYINIPFIGNIKAVGLNCMQLNDTIQMKLSEYVKYATVSTKLGIFRVTVLGEVLQPGTKDVVNYHNLNIYQAIGLAGDITDLGNKHKIKLVRKEGKEVKVVKLDLSGTSLVESQYYYVKPNDVIYVQPLRAKVFRSNSSNIALLLSAATFILLLVNITRQN